MKKFIVKCLKGVGIFLALLALIIFVFALTPNSWSITQFASILFPLTAGYMIIAMLVLVFISGILLVKDFLAKRNLSPSIILMGSLSLLALLFGGVEWQIEKQVVEKNGGQVSLLGDSKISVNAKPDKQVTYATKDNQDLTISIYQNGKQYQKTKQPVYIYIHGGGWSSGNAESSSWLHRAMADQGYVAFSINYRLATEDDPTWEKATEDVADAIKWIKEHAAEYGGDSDNILLSGESAGGQLALLYTGLVSSGQLDAPLPTAVGVMYPAIDLTWISENSSYVFRFPGIVEKYIGGSLSKEADRLDAVSPMNDINANYPPVYIIHGQKDSMVNLSGSEEFVKKLNQAGGQASLVKIPFANHGLNLQENVTLLSHFANSIEGLEVVK